MPVANIAGPRPNDGHISPFGGTWRTCRVPPLLRILFPIAVFSTISLAGTTLASASDVGTAAKIVECYSAGQTTIRNMRDCSGAWVTPRVLLLCTPRPAEEAGSDNVRCPFLTDTIDGRATLDGALALENLNRDSELVLSTLDAPFLPDTTVLDECRLPDATPDLFGQCVDKSMG
jgi:hypothetical protein